MFNIGGPELLVILLVALIVLGPQRLPDAAKQVGKVLGDLRRLSSGFQQEVRAALDEPTTARARGEAYKPVSADAPAVAPVEASGNGATATPPKAAPKKAVAKKRAAPLRAPRK